MRTITTTEFCNEVSQSVLNGEADMQNDNEGQIIIYTGMYEWSDGSIHDEPEVDNEDGVEASNQP